MSREDWQRRFREQLPFASNRVSSPADAAVNVASIHRVAYEQLLAAADEARVRPQGGLGVLLWGDPGVGKSHLLARFATEVSRDNRGLFLLIHNLLASPRLLPAAVVRCLVARLTEPPLGESSPGGLAKTTLYELLYQQIRWAVPPPQGRPPSSIGKAEARRLFLRRMAETVEPQLPDQNRPDGERIAAALFAYFLAVHKRKERATTDEWHAHYERVAMAAKQYLMGDELDAEASELLELEPTAMAGREPAGPNDQFLETVCLMLLEIARQAERLVVLCFDQVENLSDDRFVELFRFNHALLDHGRNLLIVTAGVRSDLVALRTRGLAPEAAWDRLASDTIDIYFISLAAARELLEARLRPVIEAAAHQPEIEEARRRDPLFPLGEAWWTGRVANLIEARPRDVISWAHARWREQCRGLVADRNDAEKFAKVVDEWIEQRVSTKRQEFRSELSRLPADGGQLTGLLQATLTRIGSSPALIAALFPAADKSAGPAEVGPAAGGTAAGGPAIGGPSEPAMICEEQVPVGGRLPTYDLLLRWRQGMAQAVPTDQAADTGVAVMVTFNANSLAAKYRRLSEAPHLPGRLIVLRDERIPEVLGAAGQRHRDGLEAKPGCRIQFVDIGPEEYAELTALEAVLADARSGDLEIDKPAGGLMRLSERDVEASYARRRRYLSSTLIRLLLEPPAAAVPSVELEATKR